MDNKSDMMEKTESIPLDIPEYLALTGMTKREFARYCGIHHTTLYRYLEGESFTLRTAKKIAKKTNGKVLVKNISNEYT